MERIRRCNSPFENGMDEVYLAELVNAYGDFFYHDEASPRLIVTSEHLNFAGRETDFRFLLERVRGMRGAREFFCMGL